MKTIAILGLLLFSCAHSVPQERKPCDINTFKKMSASCGDDELECNRLIDEHTEYCAGKIRGEK